jgi:hypothetical protein
VPRDDGDSASLASPTPQVERMTRRAVVCGLAIASIGIAAARAQAQENVTFGVGAGHFTNNLGRSDPLVDVGGGFEVGLSPHYSFGTDVRLLNAKVAGKILLIPINVFARLTSGRRVTPFLTGGPCLFIVDHFGWNIGAGLDTDLSRTVALRLDARDFWSPGRLDTDHFLVVRAAVVVKIR